MSAFHDPPPSSEASLAFEGVRLFAPRPYVRGEAEHRPRGPHLLRVIPLIQTQALGPRGGRLGPLYDDPVEGGRHQSHIRPIGAGYDHAQRYPMTLGQPAAFAATFAAVRGVGARFLPRPTAPWSLLHPCLATASLRPSAPRTAPRPLATVLGTRPRRPTAGSGHERWRGDRGRWRPRRPTGSRCAARRRWRRHTGERASAASPRQTDGCCGASGLSAAAGSIMPPTREKLSLLCSQGLACGVFWSVPLTQFTKSGLSG
jgi:hypothetical protein